MDWDKLRVFHAVANAGSFTRAAEILRQSQSAVSRQVIALEQDLDVPVFHRHARGLILTEQGELLYRTVHDIMIKLDATRLRLSEAREKPAGELRITTTFGIGTNWLVSRLGPFVDLFPDIKLKLILTDDELDLGMREADVALRLRAPQQIDLIRRRLFIVHTHLYASADYLKIHGEPTLPEDLDRHRLLGFSATGSTFLDDLNALLDMGRNDNNPREAVMSVNNITALKRAVESGIGIGVLPDYLVDADSLIQLMPQVSMPELECYVVYPEEMKNVARVQAFRDFLVSTAQKWRY
jgi:DNA-binding transcriptional LysR family regulator